MIKTRRLTYFTASNPAIEDGGFFGEKKNEILPLIPNALLPKTIYLAEGEILNEEELEFPFIAKPNIGQRGHAVKRIEDMAQWEEYRSKYAEELVLQAYVEGEEYGVLFGKIPNTGELHITSVVKKDLMKIRGDGNRTVEEIILDHTRHRKYLNELEPAIRKKILPNDTTEVVQGIGNHCKGTLFEDRRDLIGSGLVSTIKKMLDEMEGVYYGRFDLRCPSDEDLSEGKHIKILELNGVTSDPAHIFDPTYPFISALRDLYADARLIAKISKQNIALGHPTTKWYELIRKTYNYYG